MLCYGVSAPLRDPILDRVPRVSVLSDGFAWNGNTYSSLSQVAFAITGTHWNGPRFVGLRDKSAKGTSA